MWNTLPRRVYQSQENGLGGTEDAKRGWKNGAMPDKSQTTASEWWKGCALDQATHEMINARYYPGTRQLCSVCDEPTGRCEEDSLSIGEGPLCEECWATLPDELKNE